MPVIKVTSHQLKKNYIDSCSQELNALKPGNVNILSSIPGMNRKGFIRASIISSKFLSNIKLSLGESIYYSSTECYKELNSNYNLGIILLCAPVFKAALSKFNSLDEFRKNIRKILLNIDKRNSDLIIESIKKSKPGGIKNYSGKGNINDERNLKEPIMELMQISSQSDRIAMSYANNYSEIFSYGLPFFKKQKKIFSQKIAIEKLYMGFLSNDLDSHILRKYGRLKAKEVLFKANIIQKSINKKLMVSYYKKLERFDNYLKLRNINPGTCADLTVTTLLIDKITSIVGLSNFDKNRIRYFNIKKP